MVTSLPGGPYVIFDETPEPFDGSGAPAGGTGNWTVNTGNNQFPLSGGGSAPFSNATTGLLPAHVAHGTYTVCYTYTSPQGCVSDAVCTQVTVLPYACELKTGPKIDYELTPDASGTTLTIDAQGAPYLFPAGVYHVMCPVILTHGPFQTAPGTVFLFDVKTSLTLADEGRLTAYDTRFTAACDQMWDGIVVKASSGGLYLGDPTSDLYGNLPGVKDYGSGPLYGEVSHATTGVYWERPNQNPLRLVATHFFNNLVSVQAGNYPQNIPPAAHYTAAIINSVFDADQTYFKRLPDGQLYADWLPLAHLDLNGWGYADALAGNKMPFAGNRLADALLGVVSAHNVDPFSITLGETNSFENNRVMGLAIPTLTQSVSLGEKTRINLPAATAQPQPSTRLRSVLQTSYGAWLPTATNAAWGVWIGDQHTGNNPPVPDPIVTATGVTFGPTGSGPAFGNGSYPRTGLEIERAKRYVIDGCEFKSLRTGVRLGLESSGEDCEVSGSEFVDCRQGIAIRNGYVAAPGFAPPIFWPHCNTFTRSGVPGNNYGIVVEPSTYAGVPKPEFDSYAARDFTLTSHTVAMKNLFLGTAPSGSFYRYLDNQAGGTNMLYTAYTTKSSNCTSCVVQLLSDLSASGASAGFTIITEQGPSPVVQYSPGLSCGAEPQGFDTGFQRIGSNAEIASLSFGSSETNLDQNHPNPATFETQIAYHLSAAKTAKLVIRELVRGSIVLQKPLDLAVESITVSVAGLLPGIYTYSVIADEVVLKTRKLVVSR